MTPEQLRGSILQSAVEGKLVEQRASEGNAESILNNIQSKKGNSKKSKTLTPISEEDKIFEIPTNWVWTKLGDISSVITKGTTPRGGNVAYLEEGIGFLRAENVSGLDTLDKSNLKYIDEETHNGFLKRSIIEENDILITIAGTLGRTGLVRHEDLPLNANQAVSMVRLVDTSEIDLKYLIYVLNSPEIQKYLTQQKKTTAIPNLTLEIIENCICPLPPLEEQHRIVDKIEELLPFVDRYAEAYEKLEKFNAKFPEDMKKSILQYAIQGKLVEQRAEEGTAEELYQQIQEEKQKLIKEGKIKKEKPLAEITEDEIPFDIPESWKWVRIPEIGTSSLGKTLNKGTDEGKEVPYLCSINVYWDGIKLEQIKTAKFSDKDIEKYLLRKGDLLICEGGDVGRCAIWNNDEEMYYQNALHCVRFYGNINPIYIKFCLEYYKAVGILDEASKGMTIKHLVQGSLYSLILPLPPLEEQKRIVAKIEELLPYCDRLIK